MRKTRKNHYPHRLTIIEDAETADGRGGFTTTDREAGYIMAAIWPVKAKEVRENMRVELQVSHTIRARFQPDISPKNRFHFGERKFEIKGIIPDEKNIDMDMICNEIF